jgi:citrate synthase
MSGLLTTAEVAHRLGVKPETVYAYVSRGLLERHEQSDRRRSLFSADAVDRLAGRARRPGRSDAFEVVIETELTALDPAGRLFYRGLDATELARFRSFEDVAGLLWGGDPLAPWELDDDGARLIASLRPSLPAGVAGVDAIPVAVAALAANDGGRADRRPEAVRRAGARILAGVLAILGGDDELASSDDRSAVTRLWRALRPDGRSARPAQVAALNAALVLLADHELAASTFAARVAASAWADPYRVVLAGLGPLGGTLHGGAALAVESLLAEIDSPDAAFGVLDRRLSTGGVPGFGHRVYRDRDPRADSLLGVTLGATWPPTSGPQGISVRLAAVCDSPQRAATIEATLAAAAALGLPFANVDFALAGICHAMRLRPGSSATIFTCARIAGLIAHALEEYPHRLRFRPRAAYVGPSPAR